MNLIVHILQVDSSKELTWSELQMIAHRYGT